MKNWPTIRIEEVCSLVRGSSPRPKSDPRYYGGPIPRLTIADITRDGWFVTPRLDSLTELGATMSRPIKAGTIVMAVSGNVGLCAELAVDACVHDGFVAFKDLRRDLFLPSFFKFAMSQMGETHERNKAGAVFQNITTTDVKAMQIPLPPLSEQERIVKLLDEADQLRKLRAQADRDTSQLISALFYEMFGDPISNNRCLPSASLGEIASVERGRFSPRPRNDPSYFNGAYPFIQTGDIAQCGGYLTQCQQTLNERGRCVSKEFPPGTIVIAIVGATIGQTAILCKPFYATDSVIGLKPNPKHASVEYLIEVLRNFRPVFIAQAPETARANLNAATLKAVKIPIPPLPLQQEFAERVKEIRALQTAQATSRTHMDNLFQSMLHRAFNGEL